MRGIAQKKAVERNTLQVLRITIAWSKDMLASRGAKEGVRIPTIKWPDCSEARRGYIGGGSASSSLSAILPSAKFSYME